MSLLEVSDLRVHIATQRGVVRAVDGISFAVEAGRALGIVGESGCGKPMTALSLMRLLPAPPARVAGGSIRFQDEDILTMDTARLAEIRGGAMAMIYQDPQTSLNPVFTAGEQIAEVARLHRRESRGAAMARAVDMLRMVNIPDPARVSTAYPHQLSGGMRQRVVIAMALACDPKLLIADEPTTALDVTIQAQILDLLRKLRDELGLAVILITHDLGVIADLVDEVAVMYAGKIVEHAPVRDLFAAPKHPYARLLLRALPDTSKRGDMLAAIPGMVPPLWQEFDGCRFAPRCDRVFDACHGTRPELLDSGHRSVRCLLYRDAAAAPAAPVEPCQPLRFEAPRAVQAPGDALLEVQQLCVRFPIRAGLLQRNRGSFTAVDNISFSIRAGETLALVGESGCGKTTTGKAIVQLLRGQAVISGVARLDGQDLFSLKGDSLRLARRSIQIIFQDPFASLNPRVRVFDILEEGLLALRPELDAAARRKSLELLLDQVGLQRDALERYPHEFSGGQRQRIAIARALAVRPRLIVCDEPTSALDVSVQAQILNLLRELQRDTGLAYLFITHNIGVVGYLADRIAVMNRGRIEESGPATTVLRSPRAEFTRVLLAAVPRIETLSAP